METTVKLEDHFLSKEEFSKYLEKVVLMSQGDITYLEAAIYAAEFFGIDSENIPKFISPRVRDKIETQALKDHLIDKSVRPVEETLGAFF
jgi:hypothetical protein